MSINNKTDINPFVFYYFKLFKIIIIFSLIRIYILNLAFCICAKSIIYIDEIQYTKYRFYTD